MRTIALRVIALRSIALVLAAMTAAAWAGTLSAGDKGAVVDLDGLKSAVPSAWKAQEIDPKLKAFRVYQFGVPRAEGDKEDAELIISQVKGSPGTVEQNLARWKQGFVPPPGKTIEQLSKVEKLKVGDAELTYLDLPGTYLYRPPLAPTAKPELKENYRLLGVIFETKEGSSFIRLIGPAKTVEQNKKAFDEWLKAFK